MKGSLAVHTTTGLAAAVKNQLKRTQYRASLIDGYITRLLMVLNRVRDTASHQRGA